MRILLAATLLCSFSAHALETDNYLAWTRELSDSSEDINEFLRTEIEEALAAAPANTSCKKITFRIADRFKTTPKGEIFVNWSTKNIPDKIFPSTDHYIGQSIYRDTPSPLLKVAPLAPNIQINGIYLGLDKLSHFSSTGRRYLSEYLKKTKKGFTSEAAEKAAIRFGLSNEAGILGIWASGVFSYGDVEANYQGLRFYRRFCLDGENPYLEKENGRWKLAVAPDLRDFVSPAWDETFNLSYAERTTWKRTSKVLRDEYCALKDSPIVRSRFAYYEKMKKQSFSMDYIAELQQNDYKEAPVPEKDRSFTSLCGDSHGL